MNTENKTFDLIFNDENNSNNKGFAESLEYCRNDEDGSLLESKINA